DGDAYIVVASYAGEDRDPAWWNNLKAQPEAEVAVGGRRLKVRARESEGAEPRASVERDHKKRSRVRRVPAADQTSPFSHRFGACSLARSHLGACPCARRARTRTLTSPCVRTNPHGFRRDRFLLHRRGHGRGFAGARPSPIPGPGGAECAADGNRSRPVAGWSRRASRRL